ncbi:MAG: DUF4348 domain-containing protein, partial [Bacteroides sp.]|nr:DUF4348 domain-containing protein [Bacteroides sp.]
MRKIGVGVCLFVFLLSCGNRNTKVDPFMTISDMVDSASYKADTVMQVETDDEPEPIEADELFDDFIYAYASDSILQQQRTKFPLSYHDVDTLLKIKKEEWVHDCLFTRQ